MGHLSFDALSPFLERQEGPCLSLYQATHRSHPDNAQDPIRFKNLVKELEQSLSSKYHKNEYEPLLEPFHRLAADEHFWQHTLDGLAIIAKKDERSEEHTSELQSRGHLVCRLLLEKKK